MGHDDDLFGVCICIDIRPSSSWMGGEFKCCVYRMSKRGKKELQTISGTTFSFLLFCCKEQKGHICFWGMHSCCNVKREEARKRRRLDRDLASAKEAYVRTCVRRRIHYYVPTREEKSQTKRQTDRQAGRQGIVSKGRKRKKKSEP